MATFSGGEQLSRIVRSISVSIPSSAGSAVVYTIPSGIYGELEVHRLTQVGGVDAFTTFITIDDTFATASGTKIIYSSEPSNFTAGTSVKVNLKSAGLVDPDFTLRQTEAWVLEGHQIVINTAAAAGLKNFILTMVLKEYVAPSGVIDL